LANVANTNYVCLVGVFEGTSKPHCALDFLQEFIEELNVLTHDGINFGSKHFQIITRCFVMDAPANCFVFGNKGHSGYYSSGKCLQKGQMFKNRLIFPFKNEIILRNNTSFRNRFQPEHHLQHSTSLELVNIDVVSQCNLDYMHIYIVYIYRYVPLFI